MKSIVKYLGLIAILLMTSACEDYLDINDNPNRATSAEPDLLFTSAINNYSTNRTIDYGTPGAFWSQIWAGGAFSVFTQPNRYIISPFTNGNTWRSHYTNVQVNLVLAIGNAQSADPVNNNGAAQCKIFSAFTYLSSTVLWGDVPFSEAINPDITLPKFDAQKDVLEGVLALLDEALAQIDETSELRITTGDLLYQGDMSKWAKLARSLKFKVLMLMVDADPSKADLIASAVAQGNMVSSSDDDWEFPYFDVVGNKNPVYRILETYTGGANITYFGSDATVSTMQETNDPRIPVFYTPGTDANGEFVGVPAGDNGNTADHALLTPLLIRADFPDILYSYSEQKLLEAEAYARGLAVGGLTAADAAYREGITANMTYFGLDETTINDYLATLPDLSSLSAEQARVAIAKQQWVDLLMRPMEAWTNWRRTDVPELEVPNGALTAGLIRRLQYPPDEVSANTNTPEQQPLDANLWFDK